MEPAIFRFVAWCLNHYAIAYPQRIQASSQNLANPPAFAHLLCHPAFTYKLSLLSSTLHSQFDSPDHQLTPGGLPS
jgi:hypothetical protein